MEIKLSIKNLTKKYDKNASHPALDNVSADIYEGEFVSILGPSGCGKTTLLRILIGLLEPTEGNIYLDGKDITTAPAAARSMGIVFQNYALFENMTVLGNVVYAAYLKAKKEKTATKSEITSRALEMLGLLGIRELKDKYPSELSGGQQQRVAIARTLIHNPSIMLFDEPMSALDVATRLQLRDVIKQIQKDFGTTMIYITHDQEEAFALSDRIIVMDKAHIVQIGTPKEIISSPADEYVKDFVVGNLYKKIDSLSKYAASGAQND
ncbi:MAG: ABC transporter ATP-binding protein [Clostridia bacterium]|nr:ABC transporter ATP-binding protein [Clostridia bacterium]